VTATKLRRHLAGLLAAAVWTTFVAAQACAQSTDAAQDAASAATQATPATPPTQATQATPASQGLQPVQATPAPQASDPTAAAQPSDAAEASEPADAAEATPSLGAEIERGIASWYGPKFDGRRTSNGERFHMNDLTAAHPTLPFGTKVRVRNVANGREVVVRINDRGPVPRSRIIDLSKGAAAALGFVKAGRTQVVLLEQ
jgi:rare lipoprotein A